MFACFFTVIVSTFLTVARTQAAVDVYEETGDYIIGGLLPVFEEGARCNFSLRELETLHRLEAMAWAVRGINNRSDILPGIRLGFRIYDTCSYEPTTVARATLFVPDASINLGAPASCNDPPEDWKPVIGVVGAEMSSTTKAAAQLFGVYKIPLISFFATTEELSDSNRYPYFLRMIPTDDQQVKAIIALMEYFEFHYVSIIYSGDSYGRNALNNFRNNLAYSSNLCIGVEFEISTFTLEFVLDIVVQSIIDQADTAKVLIMFTQTNHANRILAIMTKLGAQGKLQIIGSDGWGMSIGEIKLGNREMARGAIKTQLPDEEVPEFEDYFQTLLRASNNSLPGHKNPWLWRYVLRYQLHCFFEEGCDTAYGKGFSESSGVSRVIDAVKTYAYALDEMVIEYCLKTTNSSPPCNVSEMIVEGDTLFTHMKSVIEPESPYRSMFTHASGQVMQEQYELEVIKLKDSPKKEFELKRIGVYKYKERNLTITEPNIPWGVPGDAGEYSPPPSYCSRPCEPGFIRTGIGSRECCWECTPCAVRDVVVNETVCITCENRENPDDARLNCEAAKPLYIHWEDPVAIVLMVVTSLGILSTGLAFFGYFRNNKHPLIKASSRELSYIMLLGVLLCYGLVFSFFGQPSVATCYVIRIGFMLGFTFTYAPLLTRANRIYRIFRAGKRSTKRPSFISPWSQVIIASGFIVIQLVISITWQINDPPAPVEKVPTAGSVELMCNINTNEMIMSLSYNVILVLLCSVHAFMTRKVPNNYNESRFISMSVYTTMVIWLAFIPCFFLLPGAVVQLVVMAVALIISGSITLAFMFFPKLYAVHFVSEDNVHAAGTYRDPGSITDAGNIGVGGGGSGGSSGSSKKKLAALRFDLNSTARSLMRSSSVAPTTVNLNSQIDLRDDLAVPEGKTRQRCFQSLTPIQTGDQNDISCTGT
ncbi:metabotropic glutamate receptor 2-like [Patiria miniata]|uniref:G-protein coupled receptors family 3 profile domain-containing protein n=1 Tax=Patiria miniata TaxID=46514 RepID=A0A914A975_PATMI|nr:metabotropic glutamate receptor 2-like [Patiria miniata]